MMIDKIIDYNTNADKTLYNNYRLYKWLISIIQEQDNLTVYVKKDEFIADKNKRLLKYWSGCTIYYRELEFK